MLKQSGLFERSWSEFGLRPHPRSTRGCHGRVRAASEETAPSARSYRAAAGCREREPTRFGPLDRFRRRRRTRWPWQRGPVPESSYGLVVPTWLDPAVSGGGDRRSQKPRYRKRDPEAGEQPLAFDGRGRPAASLDSRASNSVASDSDQTEVSLLDQRSADGHAFSTCACAPADGWRRPDRSPSRLARSISSSSRPAARACSTDSCHRLRRGALDPPSHLTPVQHDAVEARRRAPEGLSPAGNSGPLLPPVRPMRRASSRFAAPKVMPAEEGGIDCSSTFRGSSRSRPPTADRRAPSAGRRAPSGVTSWPALHIPSDPRPGELRTVVGDRRRLH